MPKKAVSFQYTTKSGRLTSPAFAIRNIPAKHLPAVERHLAADAKRAGGTLRMVSSDEGKSAVVGFTSQKARDNFDAIFRQHATKSKKGKKKK